MNLDHSILTIIILVPLAGAVLLALLPDKGKLMQWGALAVTLLTFLCTLHLPFHYDYGAASGTFQFATNVPWVASPAIRYHLGVDGLSMWLVVLTGLLAPLGVLISWRAIDSRKKTFYVLFLLQQVAMLGVFASLDLLLYYSFWELSLIPMTILIATFGRTENRRRAAIKSSPPRSCWSPSSGSTSKPEPSIFRNSRNSPPLTASPATPPRSGSVPWPSWSPSP
jgi:NADH-quinone oxidoreductase subunit M